MDRPFGCSIGAAIAMGRRVGTGGVGAGAGVGVGVSDLRSPSTSAAGDRTDATCGCGVAAGDGAEPGRIMTGTAPNGAGPPDANFAASCDCIADIVADAADVVGTLPPDVEAMRGRRSGSTATVAAGDGFSGCVGVCAADAGCDCDGSGGGGGGGTASAVTGEWDCDSGGA